MTATGNLIEQAVYDAILAANILGLTPTTIKRRDAAEILPTDTPNVQTPVCVIVVGNERQATSDGWRTNTSVNLEYPALIVLGKKTALTAPQADPWKKEARNAIWKALLKTYLLGLSGPVCGCKYNPDPQFTALGFAQDLKVSAQLFLYRTQEEKPTSGAV